MSRHLIIATLLTCAAATFANVASADTRWQNRHPRREQLNDRFAMQNHRITQEFREHDITQGQARAMRARDRSIHRQENRIASRQDGHITAGQQRRLNGELNNNSAIIGQ